MTKPRAAKADEAEICAAIDRYHLEHPAKGASIPAHYGWTP